MKKKAKKKIAKKVEVVYVQPTDNSGYRDDVRGANYDRQGYSEYR